MWKEREKPLLLSFTHSGTDKKLRFFHLLAYNLSDSLSQPMPPQKKMFWEKDDSFRQPIFAPSLTLDVDFPALFTTALTLEEKVDKKQNTFKPPASVRSISRKGRRLSLVDAFHHPSAVPLTSSTSSVAASAASASTNLAASATFSFSSNSNASVLPSSDLPSLGGLDSRLSEEERKKLKERKTQNGGGSKKRRHSLALDAFAVPELPQTESKVQKPKTENKLKVYMETLISRKGTENSSAELVPATSAPIVAHSQSFSSREGLHGTQRRSPILKPKQGNL